MVEAHVDPAHAADVLREAVLPRAAAALGGGGAHPHTSRPSAIRRSTAPCTVEGIRPVSAHSSGLVMPGWRLISCKIVTRWAVFTSGGLFFSGSIFLSFTFVKTIFMIE